MITKVIHKGRLIKNYRLSILFESTADNFFSSEPVKSGKNVMSFGRDVNDIFYIHFNLHIN